MPDKPDDRLKDGTPVQGGEDPRIFVILDGKRFPRPGLETVFDATGLESKARNQGAEGGGGSGADGVYCSCNKVCSCVPVCGCVGHATCGCVGACGCVGHTSGGGSSGGGGGCRCAPVH